MELAVGAAVAMVAGAFALGLILGALWRRPRPEPVPTIVDASIAGASLPSSAVEPPVIVVTDTGHHIPGVGEDRSSSLGSAPAAMPHEVDLRGRFAEIIGLESEVASLRAVASRIPALERRIAELESGGDHRDEPHGRHLSHP